MEQRIAALEAELARINGLFTSSKWWAGIVGAILLAAFGFTNYVSIPASVNAKFANEGGDRLMAQITSSVASAKTSSEALAASAKSVGQFEPVSMYVCPYNSNTPGGQWASVGCLGQYSSLAQCTNEYFDGVPKYVPHDCVPVTLFKLKQ